MQAPFELNEGKKRLKAILDSFPSDSPHWNEAQNRFQFVDRLLTECLGWERPHIEVEPRDRTGERADYALGKPIKAVLEAKREAKHFTIPPIGKPAVVRKMAPLIESSSAFSDAVHQVLSYCVVRGAPLAIVCNGPQLAIFQALTPNQSPLEGECYFFDGFESYLANFVELWSLLSPEGITENVAKRQLDSLRNPRIPPKSSEFMPDLRRFRYRSEFQENLRLLSLLLLDELEDNPALKKDFYRDCYVPIEANNRHLLLSKKIISSRYKAVSGNGIVPSAFDAVARTSDGEFVIDERLLSGSGSSRPIVVIGDVGVGKTSFFVKLQEEMEQSEGSEAYFVHIDLGTKATLAPDVRSYILHEIPNILKRTYGIDIDNAGFIFSIYHEELTGFDEGIWGTLKQSDRQRYDLERLNFLATLVARRDSHLLASIGHLNRGRKKQLVLVIDNADQRSFELQQDAFLIAQEMAATRTMLVFVALRPSTFFQSKTTGALAGYQHRILTISPPPADEVIAKRLAFAIRVAEGQVSPTLFSEIRLQLGSIVAFFNATLRSVRTNETIRIFLSNITGGNTRAVIELITGFFGSPNVDSRKIVELEERSGNYRVPLHEFTKHALLGEYAYFNAQSSLIACNIFDVSSPDPREHFLSSLIIAYLTSSAGIKDNDGFTSGDSVIAEMAKNGFLEEQVRHSLRRLAAKRLIETPYAHYRELQPQEDERPEYFGYRATSIGIYHIRFWTGSFAFLDAISTDTPIFDQNTRDIVSRLASSFDIKARFSKAVEFRKYLESQWQVSDIRASYYDFSGLLKQEDESFRAVANVVSTYRPERR